MIRSFNRLKALAELLERVLDQEHQSFEVVVVEQTPNPTRDDLARLTPLVGDPRVRKLDRPQMGGPAARNEGVLAARAQIVLLIDDDDLPLTRDWIRVHEALHRADPELVGVSCRMVRKPGETSPYPEIMRPFIRRACMSYSLLMTPYTFARFDEDVEHVDWLHGSNASFKREIGLRAGLWDVSVRSSDEHSFAFKCRRIMSAKQHFSYKMYPVVLQRLDIRGGMDKRFDTVHSELVNNLRYCHRIVGRYYPFRFRWAYPAYLGWAMGKTFNWIWDPGRCHQGRLDRFVGCIEMLRRFPAALWEVRSKAAGGCASPAGDAARMLDAPRD